MRKLVNEPLFWLICALVFAAFVRFALVRYSFWFDDLASVFFSRQPLGNLWGNWMLRESNPPLYYTLLKGWIAVFGMSITKLRAMSIVASLVLMIVTYVGIGKTIGKREGAIAALLLACSAQQLFLSHVVRNYPILFLCVAISFFGLLYIVRYQEKSDRELATAWLAYILGAIAGVYLHTTACIWPIAATLSMMLVDNRYRPGLHKRWLILIAANVLIVVATSWWLFITYQQITTPNDNIAWLYHRGLKDIALLAFSTLFLSRTTYGLDKIVPFAVAVSGFYGFARTYKNRTTQLTVACGAFAMLLFILISLKQPIIAAKTILWISLFPLTLAAIGLGALKNRILFLSAVPIVLALLTFNMFGLTDQLQSEDWTTVVEQAAHDPRAVLLVDSEAVSRLVTVACTMELNTSACPFPIVTIQRDNDHTDAWARGYGTKIGSLPDGRLAVPIDAHVYMFRRMMHDTLVTLKGLKLLGSVDPAGPKFMGPFPASIIDQLTARTTNENGILKIKTNLPAVGTAPPAPTR